MAIKEAARPGVGSASARTIATCRGPTARPSASGPAAGDRPARGRGVADPVARGRLARASGRIGRRSSARDGNGQAVSVATTSGRIARRSTGSRAAGPPAGPSRPDRPARADPAVPGRSDPSAREGVARERMKPRRAVGSDAIRPRGPPGRAPADHCPATAGGRPATDRDRAIGRVQVNDSEGDRARAKDTDRVLAGAAMARDRTVGTALRSVRHRTFSARTTSSSPAGAPSRKRSSRAGRPSG